MGQVVYLNPADVIGKCQTELPYNRSRTGYGSRVPTAHMLRLKDGKWRRVYVIIWSNSGSAYINVKGKPVFLGTYNPKD